jgi:hypothetical protein
VHWMTRRAISPRTYQRRPRRPSVSLSFRPPPFVVPRFSPPSRPRGGSPVC